MTTQDYILRGSLGELAAQDRINAAERRNRIFKLISEKAGFPVASAEVSSNIRGRFISGLFLDRPIKGLSARKGVYRPTRGKDSDEWRVLFQSFNEWAFRNPICEALNIEGKSSVSGDYILFPREYNIGDLSFISIPIELISGEIESNEDLDPITKLALDRLIKEHGTPTQTAF